MRIPASGTTSFSLSGGISKHVKTRDTLGPSTSEMFYFWSDPGLPSATNGLGFFLIVPGKEALFANPENNVSMPADSSYLDNLNNYLASVPTIALTSSATTLNAGGTATITFTLSEASTDFALADVTVSGGTLSGFTGSGTIYTAVFTPTPGSSANGVISVGDLKFTNAAGVFNADGADANNTVNLTIDATPPTIALTSSVATLKAGETATITFTLSEAATDFVVGDVTVSGGALSTFAGSGTSYTATFTPTANSTASGVISVASGKFSDAAGNFNADGAETNNTVTLTVNTVRPTIALTTPAVSLKAGETATITFTLSEAATDLVVGDVSVTGGALSNFTGSG
ncbi:MAG: Ig-like domain-containing protein, partial [Opitutaceae bacterium]|nr:Ig-like domain-containing protein [Opitutaceae bacterium]